MSSDGTLYSGWQKSLCFIDVFTILTYSLWKKQCRNGILAPLHPSALNLTTQYNFSARDIALFTKSWIFFSSFFHSLKIWWDTFTYAHRKFGILRCTLLTTFIWLMISYHMTKLREVPKFYQIQNIYFPKTKRTISPALYFHSFLTALFSL